jgi:hypothetical protein
LLVEWCVELLINNPSRDHDEDDDEDDDEFETGVARS